jgi:hypothetical protein
MCRGGARLIDVPGRCCTTLIDGPINRDLFDLYIATQLAPTLQPGDVIILDNLSSHKSPKAAQLLKDIGCWFPRAGRSLWGRAVMHDHRVLVAGNGVRRTVVLSSRLAR